MRYPLLTFGLVLAATSVVAQPQMSVEQRLERLERRADTVSDLTLKIQALQQENQDLRGQLEVVQHQLQNLERKQRDLYLDVDQRLSAMQAGNAPAAPATAGPAPAASATGTPATPAATPAKPEQPAPAPVDPVAEKAAYDAASDLLQQRRYKEAITAFHDFLAKFPNGELAPNARYWLAESYYVTNQNDKAMAAFRSVVDNTPDNPKARGAWLKIGYLLHAEGKRDEARQVLSRVIKDYPGSAEAGMARQRLDRIASEGR